MSKRNASCGRELTCVPDLTAALHSAGECGFDFVVTPLVHPRFRRGTTEEGEGPCRQPLTRSDKLISSADWMTLVVAKLSPWIQLDSTEDAVRRTSEKAFQEELSYAAYLGVPAVMVPLQNGQCENLARCLNPFLLSCHNQMFWIHVPLLSRVSTLEGVSEEEEKVPLDDTWEWWNKLRTLCGYSKKLGLVLEVTPSFPRYSLLNRWCGEPIKAVLLPTDVFLTNRQGYPVLSQVHQPFLQKLFRFNVQVVLSGACRVEFGIQTYVQYVNHLYKTQPAPSSIEFFSKGYEDYLQNPLQPLMDNLDSQTYEVFEKDPIKYVQYEKAVARALVDRVPDELKDSTTVVLMVVGAGRGPLVAASLNAARSVERTVRVYAVEKNPGALVTLFNRKEEEWGSEVTIVSCDMRAWKAPEKADIIVSELLGSFGDNELSPECLDGAQSFLKPDGISIPSSYTSHLQPLSSPKLYNEVSFCKDKDKAYPFAHYETPYVVRLQNVYQVTDAKPCFTFKHPNHDSPIDNNRYVTLHFPIKDAALIHGFAGYFDTVLYADITLSIHPKSHSPGMISWFPIYFPIKEPLYLSAGSTLEVHLWRTSSQSKVWYEWCVSSPHCTAIHNPKGRSYWIGL